VVRDQGIPAESNIRPAKAEYRVADRSINERSSSGCNGEISPATNFAGIYRIEPVRFGIIGAWINRIRGLVIANSARKPTRRIHYGIFTVSSVCAKLAYAFGDLLFIRFHFVREYPRLFGKQEAVW
jgi:hypothetical protein